MKICLNKKLPFLSRVQRSLSSKGRTWVSGQDITISFIGGSDREKSFVKTAYNEVSKFVNLNFKFVEEGGDVRWAFVKGQGSWSYVGTDALFIPKNQPTVNIGWSIELPTVRHELGHSLGLLHEHKNPNAGIQWNRTEVIKDLSGPPNNWTLAEIENNVLSKMDIESVNASKFDGDSVMLYFFPSRWTVGGEGTKMNSHWSEQDIKHLSELYPHRKNDSFLLKLFSDKKKLKRLTEDQLVVLGEALGVTILKKDLKKDSINTLWEEINK